MSPEGEWSKEAHKPEIRMFENHQKMIETVSDSKLKQSLNKKMEEIKNGINKGSIEKVGKELIKIRKRIENFRKKEEKPEKKEKKEKKPEIKPGEKGDKSTKDKMESLIDAGYNKDLVYSMPSDIIDKEYNKQIKKTKRIQ
jgi:hypothetical protein